jgi:hypothetical protein
MAILPSTSPKTVSVFSCPRKNQTETYLKTNCLWNLGVDEANDKSLPLEESLKDYARIEYHHKHLIALMSAIRSPRSAESDIIKTLSTSFKYDITQTLLTSFKPDVTDLQGWRKR